MRYFVLLLIFTLFGCSAEESSDSNVAYVAITHECLDAVNDYLKLHGGKNFHFNLNKFTSKPDEAFGMYGVLEIRDAQNKIYKTDGGLLRAVDMEANTVLHGCASNGSMTTDFGNIPTGISLPDFLRLIGLEAKSVMPQAKVTDDKIQFFYRE